jgi:predicted RNA methylase
MKNGVVYTPENIVNLMIEEFIGDIDKLNVLDPCCGEGAFSKKLLNAKRLTAYDIDEDALKVAKEEGINAVYQDYLVSPDDEKFDLIIGNPPYIKIHDLEENVREFIKDNFETCKSGTIDIFFAFIEKSLNKLEDDGVLIFIIPNSWLSNDSAKTLRKHLIKYDIRVYDFESEKVFDNVDIYCCILTVKNTNYENTILIERKNTSFSINKNELENGEKWTTVFKNKLSVKLELKNGVATLNDSAFIFNLKEGNKFFSRLIGEWIELEEELIKPIVKASTGNKEFCLFPYTKDGVAIEENFLEKEYPRAYSYLFSIKELLEDRSYHDKWYSYGRTQSTKNVFGKKFIISPLVNEDGFRFYIEEDPNCIVYSGLYQIIDEKNTERELVNFFSNEDVIDFILSNGRKMSSNWASFSKSLLSILIE